jgi:hypothetical protein
MDFIEETQVVSILNAASGSSASSATSINSSVVWVNCEHHKYVTFYIKIDGATTGENFGIYNATNKSGSSAAVVTEPWAGKQYLTNVASVSAATMVRTSFANTSATSSADTILVTGGSNGMYIGTVDTTAATTDSKAYITMYAIGSAMAALDTTITVIMHGQRYQNATGFNVLA